MSNMYPNKKLLQHDGFLEAIEHDMEMQKEMDDILNIVSGKPVSQENILNFVSYFSYSFPAFSVVTTQNLIK